METKKEKEKMKEYSRESISNLINQMCETGGFKIFVQFLNAEREKIIAEGKKARGEEKQIKNWAKLDGFDKVMELLTKLRKSGSTFDVKFNEEE